MTYLVVGLGNPGKDYEDTRHNVGYRVVKALAAKQGIAFRPSLVRAKGSVAEGSVGDKKARLLLPLTYMNESGLAVRKCVDYYKIPIEQVIIVTDDVALPFGQLRLRAQGSCGGHNGLRSVEAHLGTQDYSRLRIGVSNRGEGDLADYVLGRFTQEEQRELPEIVDKAIEALELWLMKGIEIAMQQTNK